MAKLPPERLAAALRANLKRRKGPAPLAAPEGTAKDPEKPKENPESAGLPPRRERLDR